MLTIAVDSNRARKMNKIGQRLSWATLPPKAMSTNDAHRPIWRTVAILMACWFAGLALAQTITVSPPSVSFAPQPVGTTSAPAVVTVTNTGGAPLNIGAFLHYNTCSDPDCHSVPFALSIQSNTCGAGPVPPGSTCTVTVIFTPLAGGDWSAALFVTFGGLISSVTITGTATAAAAPAQIPTLSEWALVGLFLGMLAVAARSRRLGKSRDDLAEIRKA